MRTSLYSLALTFLFSIASTKAEVTVEAEVLSSDTTSSTVRFTFDGDLIGLDPQVNLRAFLFLDFSVSPALESAFPNVENLTTFLSNSVATDTDSTITTVELRNNEGTYFDRISFVFDAALTSATSFKENSVLEIEFPTSSVITTEDFSELPVYWCFPTWGTNNGRGTLVGVTNPVLEKTDDIHIYRNGLFSFIEFTGTLESSPDLSTPFTPVADATSPYQIPSNGPAKMFYRSVNE